MLVYFIFAPRKIAKIQEYNLKDNVKNMYLFSYDKNDYELNKNDYELNKFV